MAPIADTQQPKSLGLEDAASPLPLFILVLAQVYLLFLVATSRSTFLQAMLMTCMESLVVWSLTTLFFSRTWRGFFARCRELLIMAVVLAMFMLIFGFLETTWGASDDLPAGFEEMIAIWTSRRFHYAFWYVVILAGGWLLMAWQSGNARPWWAANVAAPASVTFAGMFVACAAGVVLILVLDIFESGLRKIGFDSRHAVQMLRGIAPMLLLILYSLSRVFLSWKMVTIFTPEDWRKAEAKLYFDAA